MSFLVIIFAIFGLIMGSFLNVCIYRLPLIILKPAPKSFNLLTPSSHCPHCKHSISLWANLPLLSFFLLQGKCHHCAQKISWRYPTVELLSAILSISIYIHFTTTIQITAALILGFSLIALIFIDIETLLLPDSLTLPLIWLGLIFNSSFTLFTSAENAILGAALGYSSLWIVANLYKLIRKQIGMGNGDFKLFAVFGSWLGLQTLPLIILIATTIGIITGLIGIILKQRKFAQPLPFGPFLAVGGLAMLFYGQAINQLVTPLFF